MITPSAVACAVLVGRQLQHAVQCMQRFEFNPCMHGDGYQYLQLQSRRELEVIKHICVSLHLHMYMRMRDMHICVNVHAYLYVHLK